MFAPAVKNLQLNNRLRVEMTKNYTHSAIYFAFAVFLGVSFGTISSAHAQNIDAATPATVPKFKKKTPKPVVEEVLEVCLLYTSPSPRDQRGSRMPSSA